MSKKDIERESNASVTLALSEYKILLNVVQELLTNKPESRKRAMQNAKFWESRYSV